MIFRLIRHNARHCAAFFKRKLSATKK